MRKILALTAMIVTITLMTAGWSMAGKGKGPGDGTGPIHDILAGAPFQYTGEVISMIPGEGIELATASGNVKIFGIGPVRYGVSLGVERPVVGDTVVVSGFTVEFNGVERNIAMTIILNDQTVQLRDPSTGAPLWKGGVRGR